MNSARRQRIKDHLQGRDVALLRELLARYEALLAVYQRELDAYKRASQELA
jgi:hypothetical protein